MASGGQLPANVQVVGKVIRARELNNGKEVEYRIQGVPGLCLRINPKASAKWSLKYHIYEGGKRKAKRFPLGDASDKNMGKAIDRAVKLMSQIKTEGLDPVEIKRSVEQAPKPDVVTFGDVFEMWLERWAKLNLRSWQHDETNYKNHLKKTLGQKSVSEIVRADVIAMRDTILQNSGPVQSNRMLALFNRVMHWAVEEDYVQANPGSKLRKVGQEKPKDRVLAKTDWPRFWHGLNSQGTLISASKLSLKLMLLTGQRRGEVIGLAKSELFLDEEKPYWLIPRDRAKNKLPHMVPLAPLALAVLHEAVANSGTSAFVFPSPKAEQPIDGNSIRNSCERLCKSLELPKVTPHDLRRTMSTSMAQLGVSEDIRGRVLNHVSGARKSVTDSHYNVYGYFDEKLAAFELWEEYLADVVGLEDGQHEHDQMVLI